jgi:LacI family transcriptional regulator
LAKREIVSSKHVTIKDVAESAGVSLATASRVLSGRGYSSQTSKDRVNKAINDLNFKPNDLARMLNSQHTDTIGLVLKNIVNPFYGYLANGVLDRVHQLGYHVIVCATDGDEERECEYIDVLMRQRAAGIIAVPSGQNSKNWRQAIEMGVKVVFIDRQVPGLSEVDTIQVDNIRGAHKAMSYLLSLGHTRIGLINGPLTSIASADRLTGYFNALAEAGLNPDPVLQENLNSPSEVGTEAIHRLLALANPPTAIFATNQLIAKETIVALREQKLRIPDDISLVVFEDDPWVSLNNPPITAVSQPMASIGHLAMELIDKVLKLSEQNLEQPRQKIILSPELIIRSSCAIPKLRKRV